MLLPMKALRIRWALIGVVAIAGCGGGAATVPTIRFVPAELPEPEEAVAAEPAADA